MHAIPDWFPKNPPIYDIHKTYQENVNEGPFFSKELPKRDLPPQENWIDFLGFKISSPIGVAAGPLLASKWVALAGALGYDLPTYKTIRSRAHPAHPLPNMVFVETNGQLSPEDSLSSILMKKSTPSAMESLAVTNSFGMPSQSPEFLLEDIAKANASLRPGQVMIVSVVGTPNPPERFFQDFVDAALLAKKAGAKIIEANFSCPNVGKKEGCLYTSPDIVFELGSMIAKAIHPIPLILKLGLFANNKLLQDVLIAAARANVRAVCGINTISRSVITEKNENALGQNRPTSGICGGPIRNAALSFIQEAGKINAKEKLGLKIMGVGGITLPEHFEQFLENGADIAMTATGMMWDPYLAARFHQQGSLAWK